MMSAPLARTSSGRIALTVAAVPTGMKAGVRMSPRCIEMMPVRAAPSDAPIEKDNRVTGRRLAADARAATRTGVAKRESHVRAARDAAYPRHREVPVHRRRAPLRDDHHGALAAGPSANP